MEVLSKALLELSSVKQLTVTPSAGVIALDFRKSGNIAVNLNANVTAITLQTDMPSGHKYRAIATFVQDGTGGRTVSGWPASVSWLGNVIPTIDPAVNARDIVVFETDDAGTSWYAYLAVSNNIAVRRMRAWAALNWAADKIAYGTGPEAFSLNDITLLGRSLIAAADAAAGRTVLQLGTIATQNADNVALTGGTISGLSSLAATAISEGGVALASKYALQTLWLAGNYAPTFTIISNLDATPTAVGNFFYAKLDQQVIVAGGVNIDATAAGLVDFRISLPPALPSAFTVAGQLSGTAVTAAAGSVQGGRVFANVANDEAEIQLYTSITTAIQPYCIFMYRII